MRAKIFFLLLLPLFSLGQNTAIDFNYAWVDKEMIERNVLNDKQEVITIFYADSIPSREWFKDGKDTLLNASTLVSFNNSNDSFYREITIRYPWPKDFPVSDYRVLSIYNSSNYPKKLYTHSDFINTVAVHTQYQIEKTSYQIEKISCILQAKDEQGDWKDVNVTKHDMAMMGTFKTFIQPYQVINLIVKPPNGDFETQLRFKILVNGPPDYPNEQYIYSKPFKGRIDKLLLSIK